MTDADRGCARVGADDVLVHPKHPHLALARSVNERHDQSKPSEMIWNRASRA
jgi:hypothetical protein